MRVTLEFELPDALNVELQVAAQTAEITVDRWAAQTIEAELATRRLDGVPLGRCGPQVRRG